MRTRTANTAGTRSRQVTEPVIEAATSGRRASGEQIVVGPVQVLPDQMLVVIEGNRVWLTPREMAVLQLLAAHPGRLLTRAAIFGVVWQRPFDPRDRSVDVQVAHLRVKLAEASPHWHYIHTHAGSGYRFEPEPATQGDGRRRRRPRRLQL